MTEPFHSCKAVATCGHRCGREAQHEGDHVFACSGREQPKVGMAYSKEYATKMITVGAEPLGFRDLYWCGHQNEPVFEDGGACCECGSSIDDGDHQFLGHVMKP